MFDDVGPHFSLQPRQQLNQRVDGFRPSDTNQPLNDATGVPLREQKYTSLVTAYLPDAGDPTRYIWDGDSDGDGDGVTWTDANNWDRGAVPGLSDVAVFQNADPGDVNVTGMTAVAEIRLENTAGAFNLTGGQLNTLTLNQTDAATNTISAEIDVIGISATVAAGTLNLTNQDNDATGTVTVSSGL